MSNRHTRKRRVWLSRAWAQSPWLRRLRTGALSALCGLGLAIVGWYGMPALYRAVTGHRYFALTAIEIDGNRRLTRREVLDWARVEDGSSIWDAPPSTLRTRLASHPWIQRVSVQREFPGRLMVSLQERHPVAIVRLDALNYVDRAGRVLGPLRPDDSRDLPLITGLEGAEASEFVPIGLHRALQLLRLCERLNCFDAISEVYVDRRLGVTVFPLRTPVTVVLGWGSWREKLARSTRVFAAWEGQVTRLAAVDLTFRDQVVVKVHEEPKPTVRRGAKRGTHV